jgi:hypothetical protein
MDALEVTRAVPAAEEPVRRQFWDFAGWQRIWDRLTTVEVRYDDGAHQEIAMAVERDGRTEYVRTARFMVDGDIVFFSPDPPPTMSEHRGAWLFASSRTGCAVTAKREYILTRRDDETPAAFAQRSREYHDAFRVRLGAILDCFVAHFAAAGASA